MERWQLKIYVLVGAFGQNLSLQHLGNDLVEYNVITRVLLRLKSFPAKLQRRAPTSITQHSASIIL
eukprot:6471264-Amphidinium_carterae.3